MGVPMVGPRADQKRALNPGAAPVGNGWRVAGRGNLGGRDVVPCRAEAPQRGPRANAKRPLDNGGWRVAPPAAPPPAGAGGFFGNFLGNRRAVPVHAHHHNNGFHFPFFYHPGRGYGRPSSLSRTFVMLIMIVALAVLITRGS